MKLQDASYHYQTSSTNNGEYYAALAKEIYAAARVEGWSSEKTREMLNKP